MTIDICFEVPLPPKGITRPAPAAIPVARGQKSVLTLRTKTGKNIPVRVGLRTTEETRNWHTDLAALADEHMPEGQLDEPLSIVIICVLQRPKDQQRKKDPPGFVPAPKKPDWDNVAKNVCDALKTFWRDDAIIVDGRAIKAYSEKVGRPRIYVRIRSLEGDFDALIRSLVDAKASPAEKAPPTKQLDLGALAEMREHITGDEHLEEASGDFTNVNGRVDAFDDFDMLEQEARGAR